MKKVCIGAASFLLVGCVNQITVSYECDPIGAKLIEDHTGAIFDCPGQVTYQVAPSDRQRGYVLTKGMTALWVSGAKDHVPKITLNISNGPEQNYLFTRDPTVPGEAEDEQYALELQAVANQKAEAEAEQEQANQQALANALAAYARATTPPPAPPPTQCNTYAFGDELHTSCY